jgi:pyruvate/2-oxoglutarate dehydrogenase complex dihydrolipoamide acyltransferase (E2) component
MREMVQRTAPVVQASRLAAQYWHSEACWQQQQQSSQLVESPAGTPPEQSTSNSNNCSDFRFGNDFKFAGVESPEDTQRLLETLRKLDITAETPHLDATIRNVMQNLGMMEEEEKKSKNDHHIATERITANGVSQRKPMILVIPSYSDQGGDNNDDPLNGDEEDKLILNEARAAFEACQQGDLSELRRISWNHAGLLRVAVDGGPNGGGRSCLHHVVLAAIQCVATTAAVVVVVAAAASEHYVQQQNDTTATPTAAATATKSSTATSTSMRTFCTLARWLVTEAGCSLQQPDFAGNTPLDLLRQARGAVEDTGDTQCTAATAATMAKNDLLAPLEQVLQELATRQAKMEEATQRVGSQEAKSRSLSP